MFDNSKKNEMKCLISSHIIQYYPHTNKLLGDILIDSLCFDDVEKDNDIECLFNKWLNKIKKIENWLNSKIKGGYRLNDFLKVVKKTKFDKKLILEELERLQKHELSLLKKEKLEKFIPQLIKDLKSDINNKNEAL